MIGLCFWLSFLNISYWVGPTSNISPRVRTLRSWAKSWTKRMSQLETTSFTKNFLTWQDTRFLDSSTSQKSGWWFGRFFYFSIQLGMSSSQLTIRHIFQRGRFKPPTRNVYFVRDFACWIRWSGRFETTKISITKITGSRFYGNFRIRLIAGTYLI